jgi:glycosyltransferase involved in cell wall biosynthesis/ubiquinone/menaquinone biosynthesis C-methylase UbiE
VRFPVAYIAPSLDGFAIVDEPRLAGATERHKFVIQRPALEPGVPPRDDVRGIVLEMSLGWPTRKQLSVASAALKRRRRVWLYWPKEAVVECVDVERLRSWRRHWLFVRLFQLCITPARALLFEIRKPGGRLRTWMRAQLSAERLKRRRSKRIIEALSDRVKPVPPAWSGELCRGATLAGTGIYLRMDFWAPIHSGGSYGHTCYVAKELARATERFVCFMAHRFSLIDELGLRQVVLPTPPGQVSEDTIVEASRHYFPILREQVRSLEPAYIYERLVLGNIAGAALSQELQIPYIVEYNGSEISMRKSFDGSSYVYEDVYLRAEMLAFEQATLISVVSEEVKRDLVARGVLASKILVNPNGVDLDAYAPPDSEEQRDIRAELGVPVDACVVGFSGTFGGWHGVDVLAAALPRICAQEPNVHFLLIGDGHYKHLVDTAVATHALAGRVTSAGRVPQTVGARMLKACDMYVSPHNSHMVDSRFFGSPTKIFEYMAMAGGIVASELEQIGVVLSPALRVRDFAADVSVTDQRAVLCTPGDEDEFVDAVVQLARHPDVSRRLGRNARAAAAAEYSWRGHVRRTLEAAVRHQSHATPAPRPRFGAARRSKWSDLILHPSQAPEPTIKPLPDEVAAPLETGDHYKTEVQRQWNHDPAGSHYVRAAIPHTLAWFKEAERYRFREYAPWMPETMEFARHAGEDVLEIGGGMGTDLAQFAEHGARVTDLDLSDGHIRLAQEHFRCRGLHGRFVHHDAESLCFRDASFDVVYSNGVLHHTPNTVHVVDEIFRVLRGGGKAIVMMYAENSVHYWRNLVYRIGLVDGEFERRSIGDIMSTAVEKSSNEARPLVKVYTRARLRAMFAAAGFTDIEIVQRQLLSSEVPRLLSWLPLEWLESRMGWNLIVKARKPL